MPLESLVVTYTLYSLMKNGGELFRNPSHPVQRRYGAMHGYRNEGKSAVEVGNMFGYTPRSVGALALKFRDIRYGRKDSPVSAQLRTAVIELRRQSLSVTELAEGLTDSGRPVGHQTVWLILGDDGIERLPRRTEAEQWKDIEML